MKGVFYGRHSTNKQTIDAQLSSAHVLATKYDCELVDEYMDQGVSARTKSLKARKGISQLLADAHLSKFDFVVISNHDRIARNPKEHQIIRVNMALLDIPIVISSSESLYDSGDFIVDLIKDGNSKLEVENTRIRTKDTMKKIIRSGDWAGGPAPYGYWYNKESKTFVSLAEEVMVIKQIFEFYQQEHGFLSIAQKLKIGSYRGQNWSKYAVKSIVTNPFYAGYVSLYRRKEGAPHSITDSEDWLLTKSEKIEPILSKEEWDYCWELYRKNRKRERNPRRFKTSFLLQSLVHCEDCGDPLQCKDQRTKSKSGKVYGKQIYFCPGCRYVIDAQLLHRLIPTIFSEIQKIGIDELSSKMIASFFEEVHLLEEDIYQLEQAKIEYNKKFDLINEELRAFIKTDTEESKTMANILILHKKDLERRVHETEHFLKDKKLEIDFLKNFQMDENMLTNRLKDFYQPLQKIQQEELRRLLVYMVEDITISQDGAANIKTRTMSKSTVFS
jgi:site-specific DNA recombinase